MGGCCGGREVIDNEIEKANSLKELSLLFSERKKNFEKEKNQIELYLNDPNLEVENIDVKEIDPSILKKRINYLSNLEVAFNRVVAILDNNTNLPLNETKSYCHNIISKYYFIYDPNKELESDMEKFEKFVSSYNN